MFSGLGGMEYRHSNIPVHRGSPHVPGNNEGGVCLFVFLVFCVSVVPVDVLSCLVGRVLSCPVLSCDVLRCLVRVYNILM